MSLGKILSSSTRTNTQAGNPRSGRQFIEATDVSGRKVHRYGVDPKDDVVFAQPKRTSFGQPTNTPGPATVPAKGGLVNQIKGSARFGQAYTEVTRGGLRGHLYGKTFIAMGAVKK